MPIRIRIDGIAPVIRRHELRRAHRPGIGSPHGPRIETGLASQQQKLFEFAAEEFSPCRIVEAQRGQRVQHAVRAGQAAIVGLDADDGGQVLGRDAAAHTGLIERLAVRDPEFRALADAPFGEEDRAVLGPGPAFSAGRSMASMMLGWLWADLSSLRSSCFLKVEVSAMCAMKSLTSARCTSIAAAVPQCAQAMAAARMKYFMIR